MSCRDVFFGKIAVYKDLSGVSFERLGVDKHDEFGDLTLKFLPRPRSPIKEYYPSRARERIK